MRPSDRNNLSAVSELICTCFEYSQQDLEALLATDPTLGFEGLLEKTGIGSKCAACLLDAEFAFSVIHANPTSEPSARRKLLSKKTDEQTPFRRRIYRFLDRLAPDVALDLLSTMPVIFGREIESFAMMANNSFMYEGEVCAPDYSFDLTVRDCMGNVVDRFSRLVKQETYERVCLTDRLRVIHSESEISIGSVEIRQKAKRAGIRGTRRPQLEIVTPQAASALHGQAPYKMPAARAFVAPNRPEDDHPFLSIVSNSDDPVSLELNFPLELTSDNSHSMMRREVIVPPRGARLESLLLDDKVAERFDFPVMTVGWKASGPQKVHLVASSPSYDRISLDHL
jgi:bacterioferritin-associated ferredoxin